MKQTKWIDILIYAVVFLVMASACFIYFAPRLGLRIQSIRTGSMAPALHPGTMVVVERIDPRNVKVGDIIVFRPAVAGQAEMLVAHRVVKVESPVLAFITRGDALPAPDPAPVPANNVVGIVSFSLPFVGYVVAFLQTTPGFLVGLVLPGLFVIGLIFSDIWKEAKRRKPVETGEGTPPSDGDNPEDKPEDDSVTPRSGTG